MSGTAVLRVFQEALSLARFYESRIDEVARSEKQSRARGEVLREVGAGRTVPQIARRMGMARQSVQRVADLLAESRLVRFEPNPDHRRSPILRATDEGVRVRDRLDRKLRGWEEGALELVDSDDLETALVVLRAIRSGLER
ncbi:MAG TPA: MarR family transcriptional regulator [Vicinamibacteria bacterium]|nr:MarR family transcriptional regulator [Vicinamibacteria bacterium]